LDRGPTSEPFLYHSGFAFFQGPVGTGEACSSYLQHPPCSFISPCSIKEGIIENPKEITDRLRFLLR